MNTASSKQRDSYGKLYDSEFRARVKAEPAKAVAELGYTHTAGVEFVVKQNTPDATYFVLNSISDDAAADVTLSDAQMSQLAAGIEAGTAGTIGSIGTAACAGTTCTTFSSASSAGSLGTVGTVRV